MSIFHLLWYIISRVAEHHHQTIRSISVAGEGKGMATASMLLCNSNIIRASPSIIVVGVGRRMLIKQSPGRMTRRSIVVAATEGSADSAKSEENIPSWAKPDSDEPPPWARDEPNGLSASQTIAIPYFVYLLASAITAIAAIGSVFEYANQNPVFGILKSDSIFYAPLLGFFAFTGIPTSAFFWFKSVQVANREAEEQDRRDGYL